MKAIADSDAELRLTAAERERLQELYAELLVERKLDPDGWDEYTGPGQ